MTQRRRARRSGLWGLGLVSALLLAGSGRADAQTATATATARSLSLAEAIDLALRTDPQVQSAQATAERGQLGVLRAQLDRFSFKVDTFITEQYRVSNLGGSPSAAACGTALPTGPLLGGNLAIIASLVGTPYALDLRGAVLFFEEVGEEPYKVDRLLTQLRLAGVLAQAAGFVVGSFSEAADPAEVIASFLAPLGKPTLTGWPTGHGAPHLPLPMGVAVELDADAGTLRLA